MRRRRLGGGLCSWERRQRAGSCGCSCFLPHRRRRVIQANIGKWEQVAVTSPPVGCSPEVIIHANMGDGGDGCVSLQGRQLQLSPGVGQGYGVLEGARVTWRVGFADAALGHQEHLPLGDPGHGYGKEIVDVVLAGLLSDEVVLVICGQLLPPGGPERIVEHDAAGVQLAAEAFTGVKCIGA